MLQKFLFKTSSVLYRIHLWLLKKARRIGAAKPYQVKLRAGNNADKIVIHFIGNFIVGGSSQLLIDIIERTSDMYKHKIVVPIAPDPLPYQPVDIAVFSLGEFDKLQAYLKIVKPSLVHVHYFVRESTKFEENSIWYYTIFKLCEELNIKVIQNVNVPTYPYKSSSVVHNVFVSNFVRENFNTEDVPDSVIYPGSDFSHFKNDTPENLPAKVIGMVYRLDQDKLSKDSIEVFIRTVKRDKEIHCLIVGGGYFLEYYKKRVEEENLRKSFTFTGYVSYAMLPEYYKRMSIFVTPVYDESFGQVTPFAMSMGLAVVGYDVGALKEILGNKDTLGPLGDIDSLVDIITTIAADDNRRQELGKKNQLRARENFSIEAMIESYKELYPKYIA